MKVATSPDFLAACAAHPRVAPYVGPWLGGNEAKWPFCIGLEWESGGIVFEPSAPGVYAAHFMFLPKTQDVPGKCREALSHMFARTGANKVTGRTPVRFRHARQAAAAAGMRHLFNCAGYSYCEITRADWLKNKE